MLNLRSRSDLWFSSACGVCVCVCVCVCGVHACIPVVEHFLLLSLQPARPNHYAICDFYRPVQGLYDVHHGGRHTVEFVWPASVCVLVCFRLC